MTAAADTLPVRFVLTLPDGTLAELVERLLPRSARSTAGLRAFVREVSGLDAIVLHDAEVLLGQPSPTVRLEALSVPGTAKLRPVSGPAEPLRNARPWQHSGWFSQAGAWLLDAVHASGDRATGPVRQVDTSDLACVLHVDTAGGGVYFKAGDASREAAVTARVAAVRPDVTVEVLASDAARDWLVTRAGGRRFNEATDPSVWVEAVGELARFQRSVPPADLVALGCPTFTFHDLPEQLEALAGDPILGTWWEQDEAAVTGLRAALPAVRQAHDRVLSLDLPPLAAHGDAQPLNALWGPAGVRWFDLSEASVAHPLLDLGWTLAWTAGHQPAFLPVLAGHPDLVETLWQASLRALDVEPEPVSWRDARLLALAHRVLVYERRFRFWEGTVPGLRPYVPHFLRMLLKAALDT